MDETRSVLYIHRVALLPLNLRTVSPIYGETSKCAYSFFFHTGYSGWLQKVLTARDRLDYRGLE